MWSKNRSEWSSHWDTSFLAHSLIMLLSGAFMCRTEKNLNGSFLQLVHYCIITENTNGCSCLLCNEQNMWMKFSLRVFIHSIILDFISDCYGSMRNEQKIWIIFPSESSFLCWSLIISVIATVLSETYAVSDWSFI